VKNNIFKTLIALFMIAALALPFFSCSEVNTRTAMKSEHFTVDEGVLKYFYFDTYNAMCESQKATHGDDISSFIPTIKANAYETVLTNSKNVLVLCEAARAAGIELGSEDLAELESKIELIKKTASDKNMSISQFFGDSGVNEDDLRDGNKLLLLATKYYNIKYEAFLNDLPSEEELREFYQNKIGEGITIGESFSKNFGGLIFESESAALSALEEFKTTDMSRKSFEELTKKHIDGKTAQEGNFFENIRRGQLINKINDWLFDENRVPGDCEIFKTEEGNTCLGFFAGDGEATWKLDASAQYAAEQCQKWQETLNFPTEINRTVFDSLK
jgi:hypothetical protein